MEALGGGAVSYERGTPVGLRTCLVYAGLRTGLVGLRTSLVHGLQAWCIGMIEIHTPGPYEKGFQRARFAVCFRCRRGVLRLGFGV